MGNWVKTWFSRAPPSKSVSEWQLASNVYNFDTCQLRWLKLFILILEEVDSNGDKESLTWNICSLGQRGAHTQCTNGHFNKWQMFTEQLASDAITSTPVTPTCTSGQTVIAAPLTYMACGEIGNWVQTGSSRAPPSDQPDLESSPRLTGELQFVADGGGGLSASVKS